MSTLLFAVFALMTALAALAVLWPLSRARTGRAARDADLAVYRDQLAEITRDAKAGRLPAAEAEAARVEVARRLLAADAAGAGERAEEPARAARRRRAAAIAAIVFVPAFAASLYLTLGSPAIPGAPLEARRAAPPDRSDLAMMVRRVEEQLERNPNDGAAYQVLAPVYLGMRRADDAANAYAQAIRLLGPSAERYYGQGEALMIAADGVVTQDAARAFAAALGHDPGHPGASYYLGLAAEQDGRPKDAARIYADLLSRAPANAPYRPQVAAALARVGGAPARPFAPAQSPLQIPGPGAADVAAAADLSAAERSSMVQGMVSRLAERLAANPDDLEGWLRLARAYAVLGDKDKAAGALGSARAAFRDNAEALARIDAAEKDLAGGNG